MAAIKRSKDTEKDLMNKDVIDISMPEIQKKKFRLDRDNNRVIELNTSDITVVKRLEEIYPKMIDLVVQAQEDEEDADVNTFININNKMKELLNYAFDSDVADKACPQGTLFDPINGKFRFEYIVEKLIGLYDQNFTNEIELIQKRVNKHTAKYTKKRK